MNGASEPGGVNSGASGVTENGGVNGSARALVWRGASETGGVKIGLYTILLRPTLYGVWLTKGVSEEGQILRNGRAIDCNRVGFAGGGGQ